MDRTAVVEAILSGSLDASLDNLSAAIKDRRKQLDQRKLYTLSVGDKVRFTAQTRPEYMVGLTGTIIRRRETKFEVQLDPGQYAGRFQNSDKIVVPPQLLEAVA